MANNAEVLGEVFRKRLSQMKYPWVKDIRGKGLLNAIEIKSDHKVTAWDICIRMMKLGLLAKPTHDTIIRFAPPLIINREHLEQCCSIILKAFAESN